MDLEGIMLSETRQAEKDKYHKVLLNMCNLNKTKQKQTHRNRYKGDGYQKGVGRRQLKK